jgi:hypothetical protein
MISRMTQLSPVNFSVAFYRILLALYPKDFRDEYGPHMVQVFQDMSLRAYRQHGSDGVFRLWAITLFDLLKSVVEEHLQKETNMNKSTFIRISGWSLVLAGIAFIMVFSSWYLEENNPLLHIDKTTYFTVSYVSGLYVGPFLLAVGLLGLRTRYSEVIGSIGKAALLFGAVIGLVISLIGMIGTPINDNLWDMLIYGPAVSMFFLAVSGIQGLSSKPLPRWNGLPILAGIVVPAMLVIVYGLGIETSFDWFTAVGLAIQFLAMIVLGFILQGDAPQEEASMATA